MSAFSATEKADFAFVSCPELPEPPEGKVVFTFWALNLDCWHGLCLVSLFLNNDNLIFAAPHLAFQLICVLNFPDVSTLPTFQLAP